MSGFYIEKGDTRDNAELFSFTNNSVGNPNPGAPSVTSLLPKFYKQEYNPAMDTFIMRTDKDDWQAILPVVYNYITVADEDISAAFVSQLILKSRSKEDEIMMYSAAVNDIIAKNVDIAFSFSQKGEAEAHGFFSAGTKIDIAVSRSMVNRFSRTIGNFKIRTAPIKPDDTELISEADKMYNRRNSAVQRTEEKIHDIFSTWDSRPYAVFTDMNFIGYFVLNSQGTAVYEFAVADGAMIPLVTQGVFKISDKREIVTFSMPLFTLEENEFLLRVSERYSVSDSAKIMVVNYKNVLSAYLKLKLKTCRVCNGKAVFLIHGEKETELIKVEVKDGSVSVEYVVDKDISPDIELSAKAADELFFSPVSVRRNLLRADIASWFPLPLYLSQIDSF